MEFLEGEDFMAALFGLFFVLFTAHNHSHIKPFTLDKNLLPYWGFNLSLARKGFVLYWARLERAKLGTNALTAGSPQPVD